MPLPLILGIGAAVAGAAGVGSSIRGAAKMKEANETIKDAKSLREDCIARVESDSKKTTDQMDRLGKLELSILSNFEQFSEVIEKIQNRPKFKSFSKDGVELHEFDPQKLKEVSVGAGVLIGGLGGAAMGTAGGFAAAGATTAAVMALGTASTGTAIASLGGAAATNATLAALGGGAIAAGGGGMALGSAILGSATLGIGFLVGGIIFNAVGSSLSDKADEAMAQARKIKKETDKICVYLNALHRAARDHCNSLVNVNNRYITHFKELHRTVCIDGKTEWNYFTYSERKNTENTVMLVALLYNMCKVKMVIASEDSSEPNEVNYKELNQINSDVEKTLELLVG